MRYFALGFGMLVGIAVCGQVSAVLINEFQPNPVGSESSSDMFDVELKGMPGASFSGWLTSIESDSVGGAGLVDRATEVSGTFDSNGLLVVQILDLENPSFTFVLSDSFTGAVGTTDIDTDNDGVVNDASALGTVYDALGITDTSSSSEPLYGAQLGGFDFPYTGDEPKLAFRDGVTEQWYAINDDGDTPEAIFDASGSQVSMNATWRVNGVVVNPEDTTFGGVNPTIPEPSGIVLVLIGASVIGGSAMRRRLG